jgi:hypothetical protein
MEAVLDRNTHDYLFMVYLILLVSNSYYIPSIDLMGWHGSSVYFCIQEVLNLNVGWDNYFD